MWNWLLVRAKSRILHEWIIKRWKIYISVAGILFIWFRSRELNVWITLNYANFVLGRYGKERDVITLGWLPMNESRDCDLMKLSFKFVNDQQKPKYIDISLREDTRNLRSSSAQLVASLRTSSASGVMRQNSLISCPLKLEMLRLQLNFQLKREKSCT